MYKNLVLIITIFLFSCVDKKTDFNKPSLFYFTNYSELNTIFPMDDSEKSEAFPISLIMNPGIYSLEGNLFQMKKEGLYRFSFSNGKNYQRIVYNDSLLVLISSICKILSHGYADREKDYLTLKEKALNSKIYATCNFQVEFTKSLLSEVGIKSREIIGVTAKELNGFDDGHNILEFYDPHFKRWILADIDKNRLFADSNYNPISYSEFLSEFSSNSYYFLEISDDINYSNDHISFDLSFINDYHNSSDFDYYSWYRRVLALTSIEIDGKVYTYFRNDSENDRVKHFLKNIIFLEKNEFYELLNN